MYAKIHKNQTARSLYTLGTQKLIGKKIAQNKNGKVRGMSFVNQTLQISDMDGSLVQEETWGFSR